MRNYLWCSCASFTGSVPYLAYATLATSPSSLARACTPPPTFAPRRLSDLPIFELTACQLLPICALSTCGPSSLRVPFAVPELAKSPAPFALLASFFLFVVAPTLCAAAVKVLPSPSRDHVFPHAHPRVITLSHSALAESPYCLPRLSTRMSIPATVCPLPLSAPAGVLTLRNPPSLTLPCPHVLQPASPTLYPHSLFY